MKKHTQAPKSKLLKTPEQSKNLKGGGKKDPYVTVTKTTKGDVVIDIE
ncbi:MAG: hypothetical protein ACOYL1_03305 [Chlamydiia bacterium]